MGVWSNSWLYVVSICIWPPFPLRWCWLGCISFFGVPVFVKKNGGVTEEKEQLRNSNFLSQGFLPQVKELTLADLALPNRKPEP